MPKLSFWLVPAEPDLSFFQGIIQDVAKIHNGPHFVPHVTFYSGPVEEDENPESLVRYLARGVTPFGLIMGELRHSPAFTKAFFVQLGAPNEIQELNRKVRMEVEQPTNYLLNPHLSLLYQDLPDEVGQQLTQEYQGQIITREKIQFDSVWAVETGNRIESKSDVEGWKVVAQRKLSGY